MYSQFFVISFPNRRRWRFGLTTIGQLSAPLIGGVHYLAGKTRKSNFVRGKRQNGLAEPQGNPRLINLARYEDTTTSIVDPKRWTTSATCIC